MTSRSKCVLAGVVCALAWVVTSTLGDNKDWNSFDNDIWEDPDNWLQPGEPVSTDNAFHDETSLDSRIEVTDTNTACRTFVGDGTEDSTRYLLIESEKYLDVGKDSTTSNGLTAATSNNFTVKMEGGTSSSARTKLTVDGHVKDIDLFHASGDAGDYVEIEIGLSSAAVELKDSALDFSSGDHGKLTLYGDVIETSIQVGENWDVFDISGGVDGGSTPDRLFVGNDCIVTIDGNVEGALVQAGTSSGGSSTKTTMAIGSVGAVDGMQNSENWTLRGYTEVSVDGEFSSNSETVPIITQRESSKITTVGETSKARWDLFDNSVYTGNDTIIQGTWNLANDSRVVAEEGVTGGSGTTWTVNSDGGGGGNFGLHAKTDSSDDSIIFNSSSVFNVGTSTLAGTVKADGDISGGIWNVKNSGSVVLSEGRIEGESSWTVDAATVQALHVAWDSSETGPVWDLTLKNGGEVIVGSQAWHAQGGLLTYQGSGNRIELLGGDVDNETEIGFHGEIQNIGAASELELVMAGGDYLRLQMPPDVTALDPYDLEGITVKLNEGTCVSPMVNTLEAVGPDYDTFWHPSARAVFEDSACMAPWGEVRMVNLGSSVLCRSVADHHQNTPISGDPADGGGSTYRDALYVIDLVIEKNTKFVNKDLAVACGGSAECPDEVNIYYENCQVECDSTIGGCPATATCSAIPSGCDCGFLDMQGGKNHYPVVLTVYGDFDGDLGSGQDTDDLEFFNDHFPSSLDTPPGSWPCGGSGEDPCDSYNPLVDYNCDSFVDCTDWQKFICYREGHENDVDDDLSCASPDCPGLGD